MNLSFYSNRILEKSNIDLWDYSVIGARRLNTYIYFTFKNSKIENYSMVLSIHNSFFNLLFSLQLLKAKLIGRICIR